MVRRPGPDKAFDNSLHHAGPRAGNRRAGRRRGRRRQHGLSDELSFSPAALQLLISGYSREPGVHVLDERHRRALPQGVRVARGRRGSATRRSPPGPAVPVSPWAWPQPAEGGDVLLVEAACLPGRGTLRATGTVGPMTRESANVAMTWVRSHAERLAGAARFDDTTDVHVHLAEAARWKDGPSAGGGAGRRPGLGADRTAGAGGRGHERGADARGGRSSRSAASGRRCWGRAGRGWRP